LFESDIDPLLYAKTARYRHDARTHSRGRYP